MKYVIAVDSDSSDTKIKYLKDRTLGVENGFWTKNITEAMKYLSLEFAERRLTTIKFKNPRIVEI